MRRFFLPAPPDTAHASKKQRSEDACGSINGGTNTNFSFEINLCSDTSSPSPLLHAPSLPWALSSYLVESIGWGKIGWNRKFDKDFQIEGLKLMNKNELKSDDESKEVDDDGTKDGTEEEEKEEAGEEEVPDNDDDEEVEVMLARCIQRRRNRKQTQEYQE